ncbi:MAG: DUF1461 domain-containing protein [Candidatus Woesearchaeota archaeon]
MRWEILVLTLCTIAIVLCGSVIEMIQYKPVYQNLFSKHSTYDRLGENADDWNSQVMTFLVGKKDQKLEFLNNNEVSHMQDVRSILDFLGMLYWAAVLGFLFILKVLWKNERKEMKQMLAKSIFWSAGILVGVLAIMMVFWLFDFTQAFDFFHKMLFPQGNWTFPYSSPLIQLYPHEFFLDFGKVIAGVATAKLVLLAIVSFAYLKIFRNRALDKQSESI